MIMQRILSWLCLTFIFLSPLLYQTQSASAFACSASDPWCGEQTFRLKSPPSGMYLIQYWHGKRDDKRGAHVSWLDYKIGDPDVYRWYFRKAPGGYIYIINVKTGLVLYQDSSKGHAGTWGYKPNDPRQLWKPIRQGYTNRYMFVNKATGKALKHVGTRNKYQVTVGPDTPSWSDTNAVWIREPAGRVDLLKLNLISIRCIRASKGTDGATDVLFAGIEFAIEAGAGLATGGGSVAATTGIKAGVKAAAKAGAKALWNQGRKAAAKAAGQALQKVSLAGIKREFRNDAVKRAIKQAALRSGNYVAKDDADSLTELVFDKVYGESPDDLDIHINYVSVWPNGGRSHREISSQQTMRLNVPYYFRNEDGLYIQLVEYDSGSDNDDLGYIKFAPNAFTQAETYFRDVVIQNKDEGSVYLLTFEVIRLGEYVRKMAQGKAAAAVTLKKQQLAVVTHRQRLAAQAEAKRKYAIHHRQAIEKARRQAAERARQTAATRARAQRAAAAAMRAKAQRYAQRQLQRLAAQRAAAAAMQAKAQRYAQRQLQRLAAQRAAAKRQQLTAKQEEERWRKWAAKQDRKDRQAAARKQQAQRQRQAQQRRQQAQRQAQQQQNNRRYAGVAPQRQPRSRSNRSNANSVAGHYKPLVAAHSNKCVDVENASTADNAPIVQFQCDGTPQQKFAFRPTSNGFHTIVASHSQKCLTVLNGSMANNAPIGQVRCNGSRQQMFTLIPGRNGYYNLVASHSGKCVDVPSADMGDNVGINQFDCDNSKEQQFRH